MSKHQDRELKAMCVENKIKRNEISKNKWAETGVNVWDPTVRNQLS